jgi:hypothetical protein
MEFGERVVADEFLTTDFEIGGEGWPVNSPLV